MTFTEAAIEVLRREGKPLHFKKIAEIAARENLLDHVGKIPEETMADQLAAHCRLPHPDRRLWAVQQGTFALAEWGLDEDPQGLDSLVEPPPEGELPYRGNERHPIPSRELARATGRGEGRARRREEGEERRKRFPPPAEVAYEILAGAARPLSVVEIATQGAERALMPDAFVRDLSSLSSALAEDNRRRESAGRRPLFQLEGDTVTLVAQPEPGERPVAVPARAVAAAPGDLRRAALAALRKRLRECDGPTVEHVAARMLEKLGFRELKVAKRGREHVIYTGRRKLGLADVRHGIRILRTGADAGRRDVTDLRRDLGHYGAQIGVVVTAGDAARDARGDASAAGQLPVLLLCGEALAEAFADAGVGCVPVVVPEIDEPFFKTAAEAAEKEEAARRARREERDERERREGGGGERREERDRDRREDREPRERRERREERAPGTVETVSLTADAAAESGAAAEPGPSIVVVAAELPAESPAVVATEVAGSDEDGDEGPEGDEGEEGEGEEGTAEGGVAAQAAPGAEPGAAGERRRRRRRRRRRGGRGRGREGAAAAAGAPAAGTPPGPEGDAASAAAGPGADAPPAPPAESPAGEAQVSPPPLPPPLPGEGSDGG
ncbi:HTH domain-containing protein [Anaeromyxobacter oryzae]|uniref:HTH HARE-type domain-containing protein n=1 Tax=Anaeromyxobacter oryzae TaxID=2918170 RepID=A0ABM7X3W5_9BACT|nr:HTH domain-containing protein [Anaeromyxobacter oryzae]BDG06493.1 hypothetical protein AMOR_54890 [Anaeromyxobacter oryzae]